VEVGFALPVLVVLVVLWLLLEPCGEFPPPHPAAASAIAVASAAVASSLRVRLPIDRC
jgi:predicted membrane metal-binding protein